MTSYNDYDGVPITASKYFLDELLRKQYGFDGYLVSDSEAVEFVHTKHRVAESYAEAVRQVVEAGLNVRTHFTKPDKYVKPLREIIADGRLPMSVVDERVREVLRVKFRLGLFDHPFADADEAVAKVGADKHRDFMLDIQQQSLVLLKNANNTLPLDKSSLRKVLVAGPLADETNFMISRYGPNCLEGVSVLAALRNHLGSGVEVRYAKGCNTVDRGFPESEIVPLPLLDEERSAIAEAVKQAEGCDVIILALGEDKNCVGESKSRTSLNLPGRQQMLLEALHATGIPVVVVLVNGRPLTIEWADRNVAAILEAWHPSVEGGNAIARTLLGDYNPGGKLTVTVPRTIGQLEYNFPFKRGSHGLQPRKGPNGGGVTRVQGALYPFGYGLSYTTFAYSNLAVEHTAQGGENHIRVSCDVTNTGSRAGDEVVQLYVSDLYSSVVAYDSVLRGFERVTLQPKETKRVVFELGNADLELLGPDMKWVVEPGDFEIRVGASSEDIRLRKTITVK
jgi:beta-glucosidase